MIWTENWSGFVGHFEITWCLFPLPQEEEDDEEEEWPGVLGHI